MKQVAKRFGGAILLVASLFMSISILSCGKKPSVPSGSEAELKLDSLKFGTVDITKTPHEVTVENNVKTVAPNNFTAMFKIGNNAKAEKIDISKVELPAGKTELEAGKATTVTLKVDAVKGKYKEWTAELNVTRKAAGNNNPTPNKDPDLTLTKLTVKVGDKTEDITKTPHTLSVENSVKTLAKEAFTAMFKIGDKTEEVKISKVELPQGKTELDAGQVTVVTIKIDAQAGKHKDWKAEINVTRKATGNNNPTPKEDPELTLTKLQVSVEGKKPYIHGKMTLFVGKDTKKVEKSDFEAEFKIGSKTEAESITISELVWPAGKTEFDADKITTLTIKVNAVKGKYKAWEAKIHVFKVTKDQPANGHTLEYSASEGEELTVRYAEKDNEDDENNLIPVEAAKSGFFKNPYATKLVEGKWVYLRLKPAKDHKYEKFTYKKLTGGSTGLLPVEKTETSDTQGFPKKLKDAGYQARFKMPNIDVEITAHTNEVQTGHKVKWPITTDKKGDLTVYYLKDPNNVDDKRTLFNDDGRVLAPKGSYVYISWKKGNNCDKNFKSLKTKTAGVKLETTIPDKIKGPDPDCKAWFIMPDTDVELDIEVQ